MKFFAVFATLLVATCALKQRLTIHELSQAIQNPNTDPALLPSLQAALNDLMLDAYNGQTQAAAPVQELSSWTLHELSEALQDPNTPALLMPYLEQALNTIMADLMTGGHQDSVIVATPVGLLPVAIGVPIVAPVPVETSPVVTPVEAPVVAAASPLVQIIVNIKQQEAAVPEPTPILTPINPIIPIPVNPVSPSPVVLPSPVVNPSPVIVPSPVNPVDVIAINPPQVNPVDIIAIAAPEVNPIDILNPIPVVPGSVSGVVGPIL